MSCHALITISRVVDPPSCPIDFVSDHCFSARIRPSSLNNFVRNIPLYDVYTLAGLFQTTPMWRITSGLTTSLRATLMNG